MNITKKYSIGLGFLLGKVVVLGVLAGSVAGCVAETSPPGYYRSYPGDYSYYDYPSGSTVVVVHQNEQPDSDYRDYDDHWEYGRRGNGNFHGLGDDDVHDD